MIATNVNEDGLRKVIAASLGVSVDQVTDTLEYSTIPQWDSLAHVPLMTALETHYGVTIDDDQMVELTSYRAIRDFILAR